MMNRLNGRYNTIGCGCRTGVVGGVEEIDIRWTYFQILARKSPLPVANNLPVGLGATEMTANGRYQYVIS
jgi:hypothetical protein